MENYKYFIIHEWMVSELKLRTVELLIYALLYSICESNDKCYPSIEFISKRTGVTSRAIINNINSLCDKNLITKKKINGGKNNVYTINKNAISQYEYNSLSYVNEIHSEGEYGSYKNKVKNKVKKTPLDTDWGYIY